MAAAWGVICIKSVMPYNRVYIMLLLYLFLTASS